MQKITNIKFHFLVALSVAFFTLTTGCSSLEFPGVYRIPVMQGNIIDQKKVDQLKVGMTKRQVQFVMGTPLLTDVFHDDRWDYVYQLRRGNDLLRDKRFTLFFEYDKLVRYEGDYEPNATAEEPDTYIEDAQRTEG